MMLLGVCGLLMSCVTLQHASALVTKTIIKYPIETRLYTMTADDAIQYPGPTKEKKPSYDDGVPEECKGKTYCTVKPPNYDEEKFNKMFKDYKPPLLNMSIQPEMIHSPSIVNRQGDPDEQDDCDSFVTFDPLYKVKTKREWVDVVQAPKAGYVQKVRLETCTNPEGSCFTKFSSPEGYKAFCKQKYNSWEVLVEKDGKLVTETTSLPICCSCFYKSVNLASRFGKPKDTTPIKKGN